MKNKLIMSVLLIGGMATSLVQAHPLLWPLMTGAGTRLGESLVKCVLQNNEDIMSNSDRPPEHNPFVGHPVTEQSAQPSLKKEEQIKSTESKEGTNFNGQSIALLSGLGWYAGHSFFNRTMQASVSPYLLAALGGYYGAQYCLNGLSHLKEPATELLNKISPKIRYGLECVRDAGMIVVGAPVLAGLWAWNNAKTAGIWSLKKAKKGVNYLKKHPECSIALAAFAFDLYAWKHAPQVNIPK